ncbi:MAG: sigma 54-interacting transcriptional regulator [Candidatus Riflebacteria bacterium]|nr:sigma 54-interacting transcriptional regulator [Candidatus Riflebacteria bacterium]
MPQPPSSIDHSLLRALLETGSALSSTLEIDVLLDLICDSMCRIFTAGAASILLIDEGTNTLFFKTATGEKREELKRIRLKMGEGIAGWVAREGKPMVVNNVLDETKHAREIGQMIDYQTRSLICVPLIIRGKVIGVLEVLNRISGAFTPEDAEALQLLAGHVSGAIDNARAYRITESERDGLRELLEERYTAIGVSATFHGIIKTVQKVAKTKSTILLRGASGTGKEVIARAIHRASLRAHRPLVAVNCAALTETLLESELFGHEKGAFTGADRLKKGRFELADGGTIFLDEIGSMGFTIQSKLLRVIQERAVDRVGGGRPIPIDVRIIAATNAPLESLIKEGRFREDLYYRLNVISINLPPLKEHREDIPTMVSFFIKRYNRETNRSVEGIAPAALNILMNYDFPGNVRELENIIERAVVLEDEPMIQPERLPMYSEARRDAFSLVGMNPVPTLDQVEEAYIRRIFSETGGKKTETCRILGISRPTLDRKLERYGIRPAGNAAAEDDGASEADGPVTGRTEPDS